MDLIWILSGLESVGVGGGLTVSQMGGLPCEVITVDLLQG